MLPYFIIFTLLFGIGLIVLSFVLEPFVKVSSERSQNALKCIQILGIVILCISGAKLVSGNDNKNVSLCLSMLVLGIAVTTLTTIIHIDCDDAKKYTPYVLAASVVLILSSATCSFIPQTSILNIQTLGLQKYPTPYPSHQTYGQTPTSPCTDDYGQTPSTPYLPYPDPNTRYQY